MLMNDTYIAVAALLNSGSGDGMISPFLPEQVRRIGATEAMSFGPSSFGYDARLSPDGLRVFLPKGGNHIIDPKHPDPAHFVAQAPGYDGAYVIPGLTFALGCTVERFNIPRSVLAICVGKSTYARSGLIVNVTPLEPGWRGDVTLELHNTHAWPMKVYPNEGICQFLFLQSDKAPQVAYDDRRGKYQDQHGVTLGKV